MKSKKHKIKEVAFFKNGCDIEFLKSLRYYRCYVTSTGLHIAVMQFEDTYSIILDKVIMLQKDGSKIITQVYPVETQIDKKYGLYEIAD